ncbi:MAG: oligosaccharide flippase family protein, partial [Veillonella sp.]|nr:oligosaccharide flippase family protein [Veillonella sp.]
MAFNQSKLVENIFSMVSLRALEYVLSFILVPYLLIVLGPEKMGAIVFSQSVMVYLVLISSYGFNLTAPRALASSDSSNYAHIFSLYMYGSIVLGVLSTIVLTLGGILYRYFGYDLDLPLYIATYTAVIGNIIFPIWFFQGIQEMRYITILNLVGRFI